LRHSSLLGRHRACSSHAELHTHPLRNLDHLCATKADPNPLAAGGGYYGDGMNPMDDPTGPMTEESNANGGADGSTASSTSTAAMVGIVFGALAGVAAIAAAVVGGVFRHQRAAAASAAALSAPPSAL